MDWSVLHTTPVAKTQRRRVLCIKHIDALIIIINPNAAGRLIVSVHILVPSQQ